LSSETIKIIVESVKASEASDIKDIKPPVEIMRNWWLLGRWILLGGFFLGMAILAFIIYKRRKEGKKLLPVREIPLRPPHEIAYESLDKLRQSDLLEKGEIKQYYTEVSEIIGIYIEGRYFVVAMEMTSEEVLEGLAYADIPDEEFELFPSFFELCDLVKFAKLIPDNKNNEEILLTAFTIIDRTKVVLVEEERSAFSEDSVESQEELNDQETNSQSTFKSASLEESENHSENQEGDS